jgi:hypothetical protein
VTVTDMSEIKRDTAAADMLEEMSGHTHTQKDGSHHGRSKVGKHIHTGHPSELEAYHKGEKGAGRG